MPRVKKIDRPVLLRAYIPESLHLLLQNELYSELEGRIPFGAQTELLTQLISDWLKSRGALK